MNPFKIGDKVRIKKFCSGVYPKEICKVEKHGSTIFAVNENGQRCKCWTTWQLIGQSQNTIRKVGSKQIIIKSHDLP